MSKQKIALVFASALFKIALEQKKVDIYFKQFSLFINLLDKKDIGLFAFILSCKVNNSEKISFLYKNFSSIFLTEFINFVIVVLNKSFQIIFHSIFQCYQELVDSYNNSVKAKVFSSYPFDQSSLQNLSKILEKSFSKKFYLQNFIDKKIISGFVIKFEDRILNLSLKHRLDSIYKSIISSKVKG